MKKEHNLSSLHGPKQEKAKIKHLFQVPKSSEESKFTSSVLVNMSKLRAIMESFFEKFGPRCSVYACVSASPLLKSTSVRLCFLICLEIWVSVILPHTYFKLN